MTQSPAPPFRLLVVDDDPVVSHLLGHQLAAAGFLQSVAATGAQAREQLADGHFDLILLDVGLPDEDGIDLCRDLKSVPRLCELPVIFMTGRGTEHEILRGFDAGGVDYVVKPFEPRVLIARVSAHATLARLSRGLQCALDARTASLSAAHRRLRELDAERVLEGERERRRLADQLHDSTIQRLTLARVLLDREAAAGGSGDPGGRVKDLLDCSLAELRTLVFELSPPMLYRGGLFPALEWLAQQLGERWGLRIDCRLEGPAVALPEDLKVTLFQGARELLANAGKHARARECLVLLTFEPGALRLAVGDDGIGIDNPGAAEPGGRRGGGGEGTSPGGFGLFSLRSRIELLGGSLALSARPGGGTLATLWAPLAAAATGDG